MKMITILSLIMALLVCSCSSPKEIEGVTYDTYGLFNKHDKQNSSIQYEVCWGNVVWGVILIETIIAPIYFFGFDMFEPVGLQPKIKGQVL